MGSRLVQLNRLWREAWRLLSSPRLAAGLFLALALCAALGTFIPQRPPQPGSSTWMELIQERYGGRASLYASLGLFRIYRTPLFLALVGALSAGTLACSVRRAASIWRATHRPPRVIQSDAFYRRLKCCAPFALSSVAQGLEAAQPVLGCHRYRTTTAWRGDIEYLYGERYGWARWATLATHGAVALLVAALLLRGSLAWRELRVQLVPGQVYAVGHNTPWQVRLDRFSSRSLGDGRSMEYQAHLTLLVQGQPVARHQAKVNSPLSYRGLRVHLFSFGPAAHVRAESPGKPVALKPLGQEEEEGGEVFLALASRDRSQTLLIPSHNLQLHFSPQLGAGGLFVEATQAEEGRLVWSGPLPTGGRIESGDLLIQVRRGAFVVVDLVHDPSFLPVIAGAVLMVGGLSCTFAFPTCQLWARIAPGEMWIAGRTSRDTLGFEHHFRRLAQEVEARLASVREDVGDG
jgi:cytochrome c biogenesis protein ResB